MEAQINEITEAIKAEIAEHEEMRKELGAVNPELGRHAAKLSGMIEVLEMLTGKRYKVVGAELLEK